VLHRLGGMPGVQALIAELAASAAAGSMPYSRAGSLVGAAVLAPDADAAAAAAAAEHRAAREASPPPEAAEAEGAARENI